MFTKKNSFRKSIFFTETALNPFNARGKCKVQMARGPAQLLAPMHAHYSRPIVRPRCPRRPRECVCVNACKHTANARARADSLNNATCNYRRGRDPFFLPVCVVVEKRGACLNCAGIRARRDKDGDFIQS